MLLTVLLFWGLSSSSHGAPHQPPVDHSRIHGLISQSVQNNNNSTNPLQHPRLQINRGSGQSQIENFPSDPARPQYPNANSVEHGSGGQHTYGYDPYHLNHDHHHDHDGHKVPKINKLNVQEYITQRDIEKHKRKDSPFSKYFAEILAAVILVSGITVFLCWWNWSKRGRQSRGGGHAGGMAGPRDKRRVNRQNTFQRGQSMPELYINLNPVVPQGRSPKSGVCSPEERPNNRRKSMGKMQFAPSKPFPIPTNV